MPTDKTNTMGTPRTPESDPLDALGRTIRDHRATLGQVPSHVTLAAKEKLDSVRLNTRAFTEVNQEADDFLRTQRNKARVTPESHHRTRSSLRSAHAPLRFSPSMRMTPPSSRVHTPRSDASAATFEDIETIVRDQKVQLLNNAVRIQALEEENNRYARDVAALSKEVDRTMTEDRGTNEQIAELTEKIEHERAKLLQKDEQMEMQRRELNAMKREVASKGQKLAEAEAECAHIHKASVELSSQLEEAMRQVATAATAATPDREVNPMETGQGQAQGAGAAGVGMGVGGGGDEAVVGLKERLAKAEEALGHRVRELEAVRAGRAKDHQRHREELARSTASGPSRASRAWQFVGFAKNALLCVGWAGFMALIFAVASNDAPSPCGVDRYRYTH